MRIIERQKLESRGPIEWSLIEPERALIEPEVRAGPKRRLIMHDDIVEIQIDDRTGEIRGRRVRVVLLPRHPRW